MKTRKSYFIFISILCIISSICFYIWSEKQIERYLIFKAEVLENDIQNIDIVNSELLEKINVQVEERQEYFDSLNEKISELQEDYIFLKLLEQKSNTGEKGSSSKIFEKYFLLKQGELARRQGIDSLERCGMMGFLNSHFGGAILNIDEGMYVQYYNSSPSPILEDILPLNLIITNPNIDLGFMDARVGMNFEEIQKNAYETEINEGFMYNENLEVYYVEYCDNDYKYTFISDSLEGDESWLTICHIN